jgi:hypothetical protein
MSNQQTNRHPADALADVRLEIRELKIRESELRTELLADGADRNGVEYQAVVLGSTRDRLDVAAVIEHFGADALRPFMRQSTCTVVKLKRRVTRRVRRT